jgi:hypothetical protein
MPDLVCQRCSSECEDPDYSGCEHCREPETFEDVMPEPREPNCAPYTAEELRQQEHARRQAIREHPTRRTRDP